MIEVYIDNEQLEIPNTTSVGINVGIAHIEDPISASGSFSQTIDVPRTTRNEAIFRHIEQILSPEIFNHAEHTVIVYEDGVELIKGKAYFEGATDTHYKLQIVGNEFGWVERIKDKKLNEIDDTPISQFKEYEAMTDAERKAVFFGLLDHGCWWQEVEDETIRRKWATYADLIPFVSLHTILQSIFKGYTINAGTISEFLTRLYVTGQWKMADNADVLAEDNEWEISCTGNNRVDVTIDGDTAVVVGAKITSSEPIAYCDIFDTVEEDENTRIGIADKSVIAGGEAIQHHILSFTPTEDAYTAYKMRVRYNTSFKVEDNALIFADTILFGGVNIAQVSAEDSIEMIELNEAEPLNGGFAFNRASYPETLPAITANAPLISDADKYTFSLKLSNPEYYTAIFQLSWLLPEKDGSAIIGQEVISLDVKKEQIFRGSCSFNLLKGDATRFSVGKTQTTIGLQTVDGDIVAIINEGDIMATTVLSFYQFKGKAYVAWNVCKNYDKYRKSSVELYKFTEEERLTFDIQLLTPSFALSSNESASLAVGFASSNIAQLGDKELLVAVSDASLSPKFNGVLPFGLPISLNDVGGETAATDMLKAIMHLFNLRIYTNADTKVVHLLPHNEFYTDNIVDWSNRIDRDKGIEITTIGDDIGNALLLTYQEATPAIEYYNKRHNSPYLSWRTPLLSKRNNKENELQNAAFTAPMTEPTIELFPQSPMGGGSLLNMVDKDTQDTLDNLDYGNIPQVLVQVMKSTEDPTEAIQYVGTTGVLANYLQPDIVVTDQNTNTTISFSDNRGVEGLHKYYDRQVQIWNYGKRITCYCRVEPQEVESLRKADTSVVDFRSRFKLKIDGEDIYCRLESIENYEPQNATHKCTFIFFN